MHMYCANGSDTDTDMMGIREATRRRSNAFPCLTAWDLPMAVSLSLMHRARGSKEAQVAVAERNLLEHTDYRSLYAPVWTASISAAHRFLSLSVCFKSWDLGVVLSHRPLVCRSFPHRFWVVCTCPSEYLFPLWSFPLNPSLSLDHSCP